jgi:hypothetical protein
MTKVGNDTILQKSLTVEGSTNLQDGLSVTNDVNVTGQITSSGQMNAPAFHQTSDYRAKANIERLRECLQVILNLKPSIYEMKAAFGAPVRTVSGLIAHEVQEVINHPVIGEKDGKELQRLDYIQLIPYLVGAIQQQQAQIVELTAQIHKMDPKWYR